jgi:hypothetical protein
LHTVDFQIEDRFSMLKEHEQSSMMEEGSSVSKSQIVQTQSGLNGIKNSSQTLTFGRKSSNKREKKDADVVKEENSEVESEEYDLADLTQKKPNVVSSEVIKHSVTGQNSSDATPINFESFDPSKAVNELDRMTEDESQNVTTEGSRKDFSRKATEELKSVDEVMPRKSKAERLGYVDKGVMFKQDEMYKNHLKEVMNKGHIEDFNITRNIWKSEAIKDNKKYNLILM